MQYRLTLLGVSAVSIYRLWGLEWKNAGMEDLRMTKEGTAKKAFTCLLVLLFGAALGLLGMVNPVAMILALILGVVILLRQVRNPSLMLLFSGLTGAAVGGIAGKLQEQFYASISGNALVVTIVAVVALVSGYVLKAFRVTLVGKRMFSVTIIGYLLCVMAGTTLIFMGALDHVGLIRVFTFGVLSMLGLAGVWLAAYSLLMDLDWVEKGVATRLEVAWEWHGAFRSIGSGVWLYMEILIAVQLSAALMVSAFP